jgi:ribonucleoside-triphosphate reductase (formate)
LWKDVSIWDRLDINGKYNKLLTGGGICHVTIGEKVTSDQAKKIINYAIKAGCEHFALNAIYSICEDDHVSFGKLIKCNCGKDIKDYMTRVVGFFVPVSSFNKKRRDFDFNQRVLSKF